MNSARLLAGCGKRLLNDTERAQAKACATFYQQFGRTWWHRLQPVQAFFRILLD